jgi:lipopolysaccharide export system protein LptC
MMKSGGAALFPLALVAFLAALTFWLERAIQSDAGNRDGKGRHDPDFVIENFTLRRFDVNGILQYTAKAPKMTHFADDDSTDIVAPKFTFHRAPILYLDAAKAWMNKDGKEVRLSGDVRGLRAASSDTAEATFTTSILTVFPDDELARSSTRTTLNQGHSTVSGDNFEAASKHKTYSLAGRVSGILYSEKTH